MPYLSTTIGYIKADILRVYFYSKTFETISIITYGNGREP